ncbi:MAG: hypothetical protein FJ297_15995 [Planctomycetes bacterium]|nr:hypothetical protein [Planctomycetota bacterium]
MLSCAVYGILVTVTVPSIGSCQAGGEQGRYPAPPGPNFPIRSESLRDVVSYRSNQPIVGTHLFYWYEDKTREHFLDGDGTDALTDHPARPEGYSYRSAAWWKAELLDVGEAGIDFVLPVYWGSPGDHGSWSFAGLPPLVQAWEALTAEGKSPPRVGLFYDTSTLRFNSRGYHADFTTEEGKEWFYVSIRDYFSMIPPKMWAAIDGRPLVVLYAADFAKRQDPALFPWTRERFRRDFGTDFFLVKQIGWQGESDRTSSWGGALGLKALGVASLGPGYDHSAVPGREPLVVGREGGAFYERQWKRFLSYAPERRASIVLVETWNELHEGTEVCDTKEYGRQYIELTAKYARLFRDRTLLPKEGPFAKAHRVEWRADREAESKGLVLQPAEDGLVRTAELGGRPCRRSESSRFQGKYLYFNADDGFLFDEPGVALRIEIEYFDEGFESFSLEYDSTDAGASVLEGAFKSHAPPIRCGGSKEWKKALITIPDGRFANRGNRSDFRLVVQGGDLAVSAAACGLAPRARGDR